MGAHAWIMAGIGVSQMMIPLTLIPRDALLGVSLRSTKLPREAERTPTEMMRLDQKVVVAHLLS